MKSDAASNILLLKRFFLHCAANLYESTLQRAQSEGWSQEDFLAHLLQSEAEDRSQRRTAYLLKKSDLVAGKNLEALKQELLPVKIQRQLPSLLKGDFVKRAENVLAFGLPGRGKTHFLSALGRELILQHQYSVLFQPTYKLLCRLLRAHKEDRLDQELKKLDAFEVIILDDIGYVEQSQGEMEVLFHFLAHRYERKSVMISSNLAFKDWDKIFKNTLTTMAAIDRLVHRATILHFDGAKSHRVAPPQ
jgi:DNA replication protein DnaC